MTSKINVYKNEAKRVYKLTEEQRTQYRDISRNSRLAKLAAEKGESEIHHEINIPRLDPNTLMKQLPKNGLRSLSLFSGGGGMDLGFDKAGFEHVASYELIPICGNTLITNRPNWNVFSGPIDGDVTNVKWDKYTGKIDLIHGGPPCQPFSIAGEQLGIQDERNMWGEFIRAINTIKPKVFVAENVLGILTDKFEEFVKSQIISKLSNYHIKIFQLNSVNFGVPQVRKRVFFVGFKSKKAFDNFRIPESTYNPKTTKASSTIDIFEEEKPRTMGVRAAIGLSDIGYDNYAPTLRSGFTGKRNTTSILNSKASQKNWADMKIWANGVQIDRLAASRFPAQDKHFRLSVQDCGIIQGFPEDWVFSGAVYQILGQLGNSVCPPVAYILAKNITEILFEEC
jgi:DNA (cytosine-5)-methyltransferase 1